MKFSYYIFIFFLFIINPVYAQELANSDNYYKEKSSLIHVGDWIFRSGVQTDSLIVKKLDGGIFSHIGMIVAIEPEIKIIHATTNDDDNVPNQVVISSLADFTAPELAEKYAIARPNFLTDEQKLQIIAELLTKQGEEFKLASRDEDHLYCTTLLYDVIIKYKSDFNPEWKYANFPLLRGHYLFPSAFANYSDITWIYSYPEN